MQMRLRVAVKISHRANAEMLPGLQIVSLANQTS